MRENQEQPLVLQSADIFKKGLTALTTPRKPVIN